jgi:alanine racemase
MTHTFREIANAVPGANVTMFDPDHIIHKLSIDTRKLVSPSHTLFIAMEGMRQDGHRFVELAYEAGVRNFLVGNGFDTKAYKDANFIQVENTVLALQQIAARHRQNFDLPVIGITGSNGKTIVKEWLSELLSPHYSIVKSPKSYNSQIGVPLSVWLLDEIHDLAIFEAGISKTAEMEKLQPIIDCNLGIFTNLGEAHAEGFSNPEEKLREKLELFQNCSTIFCSADDAMVLQVVKDTYPNKEIVTWGMHKDVEADLLIQKVQKSDTGSGIKASYKGADCSFEIPFNDLASIQNASLCALVLCRLGIPAEAMKESMARLHPVQMRMEMKNALNQCVLINDAYSSDMTAMKIAMDFSIQQSHLPDRTLIVSDFFETGKTDISLTCELKDLIVEHQFSKVIAIGNTIGQLKDILPKQVLFYHYPDTEGFLSEFDFSSLHKETILVKGSRKFAFEKIVQKLELKSHQTQLEINLDSLRHNLNVFSSRLDKKTKLLVMVKASGYGSGSEEIARLLQYQKVDYLSVAFADEGVALRKAGIHLPILVLNPEEATFPSLIEYRLEPEVYSMRQLRQLAGATIAPLTIHLKLETGMHRLGFSSSDIKELVPFLKKEKRFKVASVFSHLVASEKANEDSFTQQQAQLFTRMADEIDNGLGIKAMRHILNSAGIIRHPAYHWDMVRLGIGMYGVEVPEEVRHLVKPVLSLKTTISQIKNIEPGDTVGYGRSFLAKEAMRVATIAVGYADGFLRRAGNGNYRVFVKDNLVPTVGNVCMDMAMVDVTGVPEIEEGDTVTVFGNNPSAEELAAVYDTIAYEVFTNISPRVKRVYYQES